MQSHQSSLHSAAQELFAEISRWPIYDPHSHINPHRPVLRHLDEIMGYHYYTELAHSAGMPAVEVAPDLDAGTRVRNLVNRLDSIDSTVQYSWLLEMAQTFYQFPHDRITPSNVDELIQRAGHEHDGQEWDKEVWKTTGLEAVFLTNEFDDALDGWDTAAYVPCLRTDDLVLKMNDPKTIERLRGASGVDVQDWASLREAIGRVFDRFVKRGAGACAMGLPTRS